MNKMPYDFQHNNGGALENRLLDTTDIELLFADIISLMNILEMTIKNCACLEKFSSIDSGYLLSITRITKKKIILLESLQGLIGNNQDTNASCSDDG